MKAKQIILSVFIILLGASTFGQGKNVPYTIKSIKASLYYNSNKSMGTPNVAGTLSENLIDNDSMALWNTIIGEGSALGISNQTFVVVEISGNPKDYVAREIRLTALQGKKVVLKQSQSFAILDQNNRYYAAFLIYDTGCSPLTLTAEIMNKQVVESKLTKSVAFNCGE
jgi:hypothetical protein